MTFSPVVTSTTLTFEKKEKIISKTQVKNFFLTKDKVVRSEDLSKWSRANGVHSSRLKINQDSPGDVLASGGLVVVDVDPLQLEVRVSMIGTGGVDTVLVGDDFPKLKGWREAMNGRGGFMLLTLAPIWLPHWPAWR